MRILLVDDCRTTRKMLGLYLKSSGYEVVSAENGMDAMEKLATQEVNLVMTDLNMPYMDGIELVKNLRTDERFQQIPILMVTTEADPEERKRAMSAGANGYLVKPVTAEAVAVNIRDILKDIFRKRGNI
jgi:two-component system chemotaxis response regulator CheY